MKPKFKFDPDKTVAVIKLILSNMDDKACGFHKLFKILYFSEKKHLARYGRPITGDRYIAMKDGPVPSNVYDILKIIRGDSYFSSSIDLSKVFEVKNGHYVNLVDASLDLDIFSESEIECITESISENKRLSFEILKNNSHDAAWESANSNDEMSIFDIAKAGGANDDVIKYIALLCENQSLKIN